MRKTRAGTYPPVPAYLLPKTEPIVLNRDFDQIPEAEDQAKDWINAGHFYNVDKPRGS